MNCLRILAQGNKKNYAGAQYLGWLKALIDSTRSKNENAQLSSPLFRSSPNPGSLITIHTICLLHLGHFGLAHSHRCHSLFEGVIGFGTDLCTQVLSLYIQAAPVSPANSQKPQTTHSTSTSQHFHHALARCSASFHPWIGHPNLTEIPSNSRLQKKLLRSSE